MFVGPDMPEGMFSYVEVPLFFILSAINKESPAANIYDIGTTIGKAPSISISGRDTIPAECKHFCLLFLHTKQTHNVAGTSLKRRCNVTTLQRRCNDVIATLCVCWVHVSRKKYLASARQINRI